MLNGICTVHLSVDLAFHFFFFCVIANDYIPMRPTMLQVLGNIRVSRHQHVRMKTSSQKYQIAIIEPKDKKDGKKKNVRSSSLTENCI